MQFLLTVSIDESLPIEEQRQRAREVIVSLDRLRGVDVNSSPSPYVNPFYYTSTLKEFAAGAQGNPPEIVDDPMP